ncbi:DUF1254 domain-containing protein [Mesorhizobium sp. BE184]|uniref:DUF1254 domain-containing protein n=1 Tax=Mesorhizobium sp. BE184 TaxID=2817714 RepID=UPI0028566360|nr:DUF1254 domain-containing protein [Mesorhizobium sp. BE184]MDR7031724.1 putative membrane protein [Mesorhizobium sp. BE184]
MRRLLHAIMLGILGAGIVHIVVLFLVPEFSDRNAWSRLSEVSGLYTMVRLDAEPAAAPVVKGVDPLFQAAACRFDLGDGMLQIKAPGKVPFWSVAVYDRGGHILYSLNDHSVINGVLDAVVLTPAQMLEVRKELPPEFESSVFIEVPANEGIAVIRAFTPDSSWEPAVSRFLEDSACQARPAG